MDTSSAVNDESDSTPSHLSPHIPLSQLTPSSLPLSPHIAAASLPIHAQASPPLGHTPPLIHVPAPTDEATIPLAEDDNDEEDQLDPSQYQHESNDNLGLREAEEPEETNLRRDDDGPRQLAARPITAAPSPSLLSLLLLSPPASKDSSAKAVGVSILRYILERASGKGFSSQQELITHLLIKLDSLLSPLEHPTSAKVFYAHLFEFLPLPLPASPHNPPPPPSAALAYLERYGDASFPPPPSLPTTHVFVLHFLRAVEAGQEDLFDELGTDEGRAARRWTR